MVRSWAYSQLLVRLPVRVQPTMVAEFTGDVEIVRVAIGIMLLLLVPSVAAAEPRIALIITNQAYTQAGASLANTHRDGEQVKNALEKVGFKPWVVKDTGNEHALLRTRAAPR